MSFRVLPLGDDGLTLAYRPACEKGRDERREEKRREVKRGEERRDGTEGEKRNHVIR